jgi:hypothetical protein
LPYSMPIKYSNSFNYVFEKPCMAPPLRPVCPKASV